VSGPFGTEREAREAIPRADGMSITQANRDALWSAITAGGADLGAYDRQILDWLADWEPATVAVVAGLITRAHNTTAGLTQDQLATVLLALREARDAHVGKLVGCRDCDAAETAGLRACAAHLADDDMAERYTALGELLAGEVTP
jgi:hypothetical protein